MNQIKIALHGTDVSNEISLLEYGLLVSNECNEDGSGSHFCVYRVGDGFSSGHVYPADIVNLLNGKEWLNESEIQSFIEYTGCSHAIEFLELPLCQQLFDLLSYYGPENIMGGYGMPEMTENEAIELYLD